MSTSKLRVGPEYLAKALALPKGVRIVGAHVEPSHRCVMLSIEGDEVPDSQFCAPIMRMGPNGRAEFVRFDIESP